MSNGVQQVTSSGVTKLATLIVFSIVTNQALADLAGGISKATSTAEQLKTGMLTVGGIIAVIYLLWKALEAWRGRCDWGEFAMSVGYVAVAGASAVLAGWAWTVFTS